MALVLGKGLAVQKESLLIASTPCVPEASPGTTCWEFNGINSYMEVAAPTGLTFGDSTQDFPFSISLWVKFTTYVNQHVYLNKTTSGLPSNGEWIIRQNVSNTSLLFYDQNNFYKAGRRTSADFPTLTNVWNHLVFAYDGRGNDGIPPPGTYPAGLGINVYQDAVNIWGDTESGTQGVNIYYYMHDLSTPIQIGTKAGDAGTFYNGKIADISIWNKQLSQEEVTAIYNCGQPRDERTAGLQANLLTYWGAWNGGANPVDMGINTNNATASPTPPSVVSDYPVAIVP